LKNTFQCKKCNHEWRSLLEKPNKCPSCQRVRWWTLENKKTGRKENTLDKFFNSIIKKDGCWGWAGTVNANGYAVIKLNGKLRLASRVSHELYIGKITDGMNVCHRCDNPLCVNPDHLFLGTTQDNVNDRVSKGRSAIGPKNFNTKLSPDQVMVIRGHDYTKLGEKAVMARMMGVSQTAIGMVLKYKNFKYL